MHDRPYTLLSCSVSMDGYIASAASRLLLSNDQEIGVYCSIKYGKNLHLYIYGYL